MITAALTRYWSSDSDNPPPPRDLLSLGQSNVPTLSPLYPVGRGDGLTNSSGSVEEQEED